MWCAASRSCAPSCRCGTGPQGAGKGRVLDQQQAVPSWHMHVAFWTRRAAVRRGACYNPPPHPTPALPPSLPSGGGGPGPSVARGAAKRQAAVPKSAGFHARVQARVQRVQADPRRLALADGRGGDAVGGVRGRVGAIDHSKWSNQVHCRPACHQDFQHASCHPSQLPSAASRFMNAMAAPGEVVGTVAAQSIGEPTTQVRAALLPAVCRQLFATHHLHG